MVQHVLAQCGPVQQAPGQCGPAGIISGTGSGFDASLLEPEGWHTRTIVEDMEFSMQQNFKGVFSVYQDDARFYDEQPVTWKGW